MANIFQTQTINDGHRNLVLKTTGFMDSANQPYTILVDPATLNTIVVQGTQHSTKLRLHKVDFIVQDGLAVTLYWDVDGTQANAGQIAIFEGRGIQDYFDFGSIPNQTIGANGKVGISTLGWNTGLVLTYTLILYFIKAT